MGKFQWGDEDEIFETMTDEGRLAFEEAQRKQAARLAELRLEREQEQQMTTVEEDSD